MIIRVVIDMIFCIMRETLMYGRAAGLSANPLQFVSFVKPKINLLLWLIALLLMWHWGICLNKGDYEPVLVVDVIME